MYHIFNTNLSMQRLYMMALDYPHVLFNLSPGDMIEIILLNSPSNHLAQEKEGIGLKPLLSHKINTSPRKLDSQHRAIICPGL